MRKGFLVKAAEATKENIRSWRERFGAVGSGGRETVPPFLPARDRACGVIAEVKRRSPSRGDLMGDRDPAVLHDIYREGGAEAVSVVVEERHFGGSPELFLNIRRRTDLPLLWKDFVIDPFQVHLAAGLGASAVLLIAGMLTADELASLGSVASDLGLRSLVEIHDEEELEMALESGADLVGVNNRDLESLEVDISVSERLKALLPVGVQCVSESGIKGPEDVRRMARLGYRAVLVGEALVTSSRTAAVLSGMVEAGKTQDSG